ADPDTVSLVEYLADNAVGQPVLFAVSLRTEPPSPASDLARRQRGRAGIVHFPLGRLSEREVAEMIAACSCRPPSPVGRTWSAATLTPGRRSTSPAGCGSTRWR